MKKLTFYFIIGALATATACSSADTATDDTAADTTMTTDTEDATTTDATTTDASAGTTTTETLDATTIANMDDATFMMTAASSNMFEVQAGNLAVQNATDPKVKEFAQMMVDHHTKANEELKMMASQMGTTLPENLMPMHQTLIEDLTGKTGDEFDEDYMDAVETAHKVDLALFEAKSNNAADANVKAFAVKTLPVLQNHQNMATSIEDTVD